MRVHGSELQPQLQPPDASKDRLGAYLVGSGSGRFARARPPLTRCTAKGWGHPDGGAGRCARPDNARRDLRDARAPRVTGPRRELGTAVRAARRGTVRLGDGAP